MSDRAAIRPYLDSAVEIVTAMRGNDNDLLAELLKSKTEEELIGIVLALSKFVVEVHNALGVGLPPEAVEAAWQRYAAMLQAFWDDRG